MTMEKLKSYKSIDEILDDDNLDYWQKRRCISDYWENLDTKDSDSPEIDDSDDDNE